MKTKKQQGFTLIEMMIVIAVLAILAVIAYPSYQNYLRHARMEDARAALVDNVKVMAQQYSRKNTFCATTGSTGCATFPELPEKTTRYYDLRIETTLSGADNFILSAIPQNGVYGDDTLTAVPLHLHYSSLNGSFFKCKKGVKIGDEPGCENF